MQVAVVTGSSSGIGFETSVLLARNGFYTYATMSIGVTAETSEMISGEQYFNFIMYLPPTETSLLSALCQYASMYS
jgi:NAD(P)-dependent dehydrogenase (short-subunit alcohol dehydrogenase family)